MESGWEIDVEVQKGWDLCLCGVGCCGGGVGGGGSVDCSNGGDGCDGVDGSGGNSGVGDGGESGVCRSVGGGLCQSGGNFVVFGVEVMEGVELVVECAVSCVVRLVLWCVNERGYFLRCFSLKLVEINGLSVAGFLFGMVIWVGILFNVVVVEVVVVKTVDVVQVWFFIFFRRGCLGDIMDLRVVIEVVIGVVVLVRWSFPVV